jgi:hypothetical protein
MGCGNGEGSGQAVAVALLAAEGNVGEAEKMLQSGLVFAWCERNQAWTLVAGSGGVRGQRFEP